MYGFGYPFGCILVNFSVNFAFILVSCSCAWRLLLFTLFSWCCVRFGCILASFLMHFGFILSAFWHHFGYFFSSWRVSGSLSGLCRELVGFLGRLGLGFGVILDSFLAHFSMIFLLIFISIFYILFDLFFYNSGSIFDQKINDFSIDFSCFLEAFRMRFWLQIATEISSNTKLVESQKP